MNQKHAREARILNRLAGRLLKKSALPIDEKTGVVGIGPMVGFHKLPRAVKRMFESKAHREKGKLTRYWRSGVAHHLKARGIVLKGDERTRVKALLGPMRVMSRSTRRRLERVFNGMMLSGRHPQ